MGLETTTTSKKFVTIAQGEFRQKVKEGTDGAILREYKTPAGVEGSKWELVGDMIADINDNGLKGVIKNVVISTKEWGKVLELEIESSILSMNANSKYAKTFMERLQSLDITQPVEIKPYDFKPDDSEYNRIGVTVYQLTNKIPSYYIDTKDWKNKINGMPSFKEGENYAIYKLQVIDFLVKETEEFIAKNIPEDKQQIELKDIPVVDTDEEIDFSKL